MRSLIGKEILLLISVPIMADQAEHEAAIREAVEGIRAAWNAHDANAAVAGHVENIESLDGSRKGKAAEEKYVEGLVAGPLKDVQAKLLDEIGIVFVTPAL